MTAPVISPSLASLLPLVDESVARSMAAEEQLVAESDGIYAKHYALYLALRDDENTEGDLHPFLSAALLAAVVLLITRAFRSGSAEGSLFGRAQLIRVGLPLPDSVPSLASDFVDAVTRDFLAGQVELASKGPGAVAESLVSALSQRARVGVLMSYHAGRNSAVESLLAQAAESWTGEVHKLWVARFDLESPPCPQCVRLHGMHVEVFADFPVPDEETAPYLGVLSRPPRHPRCRCSLLVFLPTVMTEESGPTPLSMALYADQVLRLCGSDSRLDFVGASVVRVEAYTRVVNGRTEHVDGYFYDVARGVKVSPSKVPGHKARKVSLHKAKVLVQDRKTKKTSKSTDSKGPGVSTPEQKWARGTYHVTLPDGTTTEMVVSSDGSSKSTVNGQTERAGPEQTFQFLSFWQEHLEQVDGSDADLDDVEHPSFNIGGVPVNADLVKEAIDILKAEPSTSVKAPLKAADHPLAAADLRSFADERGGTKHHYSKLKQGVITALQQALKGDQPKKEGKKAEDAPSAEEGAPSRQEDVPEPVGQGVVGSKEAASGGATGEERPEAPSDTSVARDFSVGEVKPAALPPVELREWRNVLDSTRVAFRVTPVAGDLGSGIAAALQKVASTRHRYYVHADEFGTKVSMKLLPLTGSGVDFMVHSNGSVWERLLDADGVERMRPVAVGQVLELINDYLHSPDTLTLDRAASDVRAVKDDQLDGFMQEALTSDNMEAFELFAVEADRRDVRGQRSRAQDEERAAQLEKLLETGVQEEDAIEEVYGVSGETQRRKSAIASLRTDGYTGVNLDELSRKAFRDDVYRRYIEAEDSMQGHMLNKEGESRGISPLTLFTGPEAVAHRWASPELVDWWEAHGRVSYEQWFREFLAQFGVNITV